jgi:hypothetical protein
MSCFSQSVSMTKRNNIVLLKNKEVFTSKNHSRLFCCNLIQNSCHFDKNINQEKTDMVFDVWRTFRASTANLR